MSVISKAELVCVTRTACFLFLLFITIKKCHLEWHVFQRLWDLGSRNCKLDKHQGWGRQDTSVASGFRGLVFVLFFKLVPNDEGGWRLKSVSKNACDLTGRATAYADANRRS